MKLIFIDVHDYILKVESDADNFVSTEIITVEKDFTCTSI